MSQTKAAMTPGQLRELLNRNQISVTDASKKIGVSRSTMNRWLFGEVPIRKSWKMLIESIIK